MKKNIGIVLIVLGALFFISGATIVANARNFGEVVGMFLPGMLLLIIGLSLLQSKPASPKTVSAKSKSSRPRPTRKP